VSQLIQSHLGVLKLVLSAKVDDLICGILDSVSEKVIINLTKCIKTSLLK